MNHALRRGEMAEMMWRLLENIHDQESKPWRDLTYITIGIPIRLTIPTINVDAPIESVGLTSESAMGVPQIPANTAWFNLGPRPGEIGSAVIAGHYGTWRNGEGSVFDAINTLVQGDSISVEDEMGMTKTFVVREIRSYDPTANAIDVFNSYDGRAHLNLITCEGIWSDSSQQYSQRLVVFADEE
jgi:LPXTG-site transpeptidase (sortase) family protein